MSSRKNSIVDVQLGSKYASKYWKRLKQSGTLTKLFKRQLHKIVKHTQTTRQQFPDELFARIEIFCGVGAYEVNVKLWRFFVENKSPCSSQDPNKKL